MTVLINYRGYLGPGGLHDNASYINCTGGSAGLIDRWFFGEPHIYQHPTCKVYFFPFNQIRPLPEGDLFSFHHLAVLFWLFLFRVEMGNCFRKIANMCQLVYWLHRRGHNFCLQKSRTYSANFA